MTDDQSDVHHILRWESPPRRDRMTGRSDWGPVADELRAHPERWALVYESKESDVRQQRARAVASGIRSATLTVFRPGGSFESQCRKIDGRMRVYARFVLVPAIAPEAP